MDTVPGESADATPSASSGDASPAAQCPQLDALPLNALLDGPPVGQVIHDGAVLEVAEVDLGELEDLDDLGDLGDLEHDAIGLVAMMDDGQLVLPLDGSGDPEGIALWSSAAGVFVGDVELDYDEESSAVSFPMTTLLRDDGAGEISIGACLLVGTGASRFTLDGTSATLEGPLGSLTYAQVQRIQAEHPEVQALILRDVPGSLNDEINVETGRLVRRAGWSTFVPSDGVIASGGVDLFCAGATRSIDDGAMLGVHSWSDGSMDGVDYPPEHPAHEMQLAYFAEMLGDPAGPDFYWFTLRAASAADIHWMTAEEIAQHPLITEPRGR